MAVNIVNVSVINGITTGLTPATTGATVLLPNPNATHVFKIDQIMVANLTTSAATATIQYYSNAAVAQNGTPAGGAVVSTLAYQISVPPNSSVILSDKTTSFYLVDGNSITVTSGTGNALSYTVSYEDIQ